MLSVGTTLATLITLNSNENTEFGQGVLATTACDSNGMNITPMNSFLNAPNNKKFTFNAIQMEHISGNCAGKDLVIRVYDENGDPLPLTSDTQNPVTEIRLYFHQMDSNLLIGTTDDDPDTVSSYGYWAKEFTLVTSMQSTPITVTAIGNLLATGADVPQGGDTASLYFEIDATENSVQIALDPSGEFISGFSDSRHVYKISVESKEHGA